MNSDIIYLELTSRYLQLDEDPYSDRVEEGFRQDSQSFPFAAKSPVSRVLRRLASKACPIQQQQAEASKQGSSSVRALPI